MKQLALLLITSVASVVLVEGLLRLIQVPGPLVTGWAWKDSPGRKESRYKELITNQFGYRGQEIEYGDDDYVVVLVGDSQVEAYPSAHDRLPEKYLQSFMRQDASRSVKVFSIASSGWGQDQQLLALERYFEEYRADLVLAWITPINDFWENTFPNRSTVALGGHLKPTFLLKERASIDRDGEEAVDSGIEVGRRRVLTSSEVEQESQLLGPFYLPGDYYRGSAVLQLLEGFLAKIAGETLEGRIVGEWIERLPAGHDLSEAYPMGCKGLDWRRESTFYQQLYEVPPGDYGIYSWEDFINSRSHQTPYAVNRSPRDEYSIRITRVLFKRLEALATRNSAEFYAFYPVREDLDKRAAGMIKCYKQVQHTSRFRMDVDYLKMVREIVDPDKLLIFEMVGGIELNHSSEDLHFGDLGNEQAMRKLSKALVSLCDSRGESPRENVTTALESSSKGESWCGRGNFGAHREKKPRFGVPPK